MKHKLLLLISLLLGSTAFAQQETKKEPVSRRANNTLGVCMMGKTMQCNGISMSYIASEQGKIGFAFGAEYDREYMLGATPLGLVTGIRMEYSRPYAKFECTPSFSSLLVQVSIWCFSARRMLQESCQEAAAISSGVRSKTLVSPFGIGLVCRGISA